MPNFLTFILTDPKAVKAIFRTCPHFDGSSLDGIRKPFDKMLQAMHEPATDANSYARAFTQKCGDDVQLVDRGGMSACIFRTPVGQFSVIGHTQTKGWLLILGNWESAASVRENLKPLIHLCDPTQQMINFPNTDQQILEPITLAEALERLTAA